MEKKVEKSTFETALDAKLLSTVHQVLKDHELELTDKIQKLINKYVLKIVKKTDKQIKKALKAD